MIFFQFAHLSAFIPIQERKISLGLLLDSKVIPLRILSSFSLPRFSFGLWSQPTENPAQFLTVAVIGGNWVRVGCDAEGLHLRNCFRRGFICTRRCWSTEHNIVFWSVWGKQTKFLFFLSLTMHCSDCICLQTCQTQWAVRANRIWQKPPSSGAQAAAWWPEAGSTWTSRESSLVTACGITWRLIMIANSLCKYFSWWFDPPVFQKHGITKWSHHSSVWIVSLFVFFYPFLYKNNTAEILSFDV